MESFEKLKVSIVIILVLSPLNNKLSVLFITVVSFIAGAFIIAVSAAFFMMSCFASFFFFGKDVSLYSVNDLKKGENFLSFAFISNVITDISNTVSPAEK